MKNIQLNYQNNKDNRNVERWYADNENEIDLIPQKENTQIYCINDNKMYQMEVLDDEQNLTGKYINFIGRNKTNIDKLKINFQPQQNLNGFDRPWTGGNGTNQLDFDNATIYKGTVSGTADNFTFTVTGSGATGIFFSLPDSFAGKTMYLSGIITRTGTHANNIAVQLQRKKNGTTLYIAKANYTDNAITLEDLSIELPSDSISFVLRIIASASADNSTGETMTVSNLRLCDETGQTWSPYANICPIYGHTSAMATRIGANFLRPDPLGIGGTVGAFADGEYTFTVDESGNAYVTYPLPAGLAGKTVYLSGIVRRTGAHANNYAARIVRRANGIIGYQFFPYYTDNEAVYADASVTIPAGATNIYLQVIASATADASTGETMTVKDLRLCLAAGQPYMDYQRDDYTVSFGQTIYGGTLDFVTGVLTETWGYIASYNGETLPSEWISDRDVYAEGATPTTGAAVAYKLATPQTIQLTPQEIITLLGENRIWSDSGIITAKIETKGLTLLPIAPIK